MSALRLYFDADAMQRAVVQGLRARSVDATSAQEVGLAGATDEQQLEFAANEARCLFSFNVSDFYRLHTEYLAQGKSHAGLVLAPQQQYSIGERIRRLLKLVAAESAEEMQDRIEFLSGWG